MQPWITWISVILIWQGHPNDTLGCIAKNDTYGMHCQKRATCVMPLSVVFLFKLAQGTGYLKESIGKCSS